LGMYWVLLNQHPLSHDVVSNRTAIPPAGS
jgi:hypothetical protein